MTIVAPLGKERLNPTSSDRGFTKGGSRHKIQVAKNPQDKTAHIFILKGTVISDLDHLSSGSISLLP